MNAAAAGPFLSSSAPNFFDISRPRLIEQLNAGIRQGHKLTLISSSAGFGKTTLVANWLDDVEYQAPGCLSTQTTTILHVFVKTQRVCFSHERQTPGQAETCQALSLSE